VSIQEDEEEVIHYRNLSSHHAGSEEEALNLVREGQGRRGSSAGEERVLVERGVTGTCQQHVC
jgi:hypothetical protein